MLRFILTVFGLTLLTGSHGCKPNSASPQATTVEPISSQPVFVVPSATQRLQTGSWFQSGPNGSTKTIQFIPEGRVMVTDQEPRRAPSTTVLVYKVAVDEGDHLVIDFSDGAGAQAKGIRVDVSPALRFPSGGAFGLEGIFMPR